MTLFERIQELAKKRDKTLKDISLELGYSKNYLYTLQKQSPKAENLQVIADYFHVSTDYLLGRTSNPTLEEESLDYNSTKEFFAIQRKSKRLTQKDQQRLLKIMEATFDDLDNDDFEEDEDEDL
ncbi:cro/CI family phage transcriptional regulator [Enterococcus sp. 8G7_MSG3316]|uniref:Cro/CI family phage transcriptional regulator n=1 Tax=Candidatus Enterococcus testudinis TaxID=1834191 RepID=A0A242A6U8_9ENTE|nr:helix-turn-helix transcriptional regulator [Enterococcus sp. 8G7_MSG3316]OTN76766.1 cro/CI family phage transcriptional regulator [Enterococcus sp. 8G7_MSG3316]